MRDIRFGKKKLKKTTSFLVSITLTLTALVLQPSSTVSKAQASAPDDPCVNQTTTGVTLSTYFDGADCVIAFKSGSGSWTVPADVVSVSYLLVGGGGGGGVRGGGGAGAFIEAENMNVTPGAQINVVVGPGGASGSASQAGANGSPSQFNSVTAFGGGGGSSTPQYNTSDSIDSRQVFVASFPNGEGGSGGGGMSAPQSHWNSCVPTGSSNISALGSFGGAGRDAGTSSPGDSNAGGDSLSICYRFSNGVERSFWVGGGGGGAGEAGFDATWVSQGQSAYAVKLANGTVSDVSETGFIPGAGGNGKASQIVIPTSTAASALGVGHDVSGVIYFAGGGAGGANYNSSGVDFNLLRVRDLAGFAGLGGGGRTGAGAANTGGGGSGWRDGNGGSGLVAIRYSVPVIQSPVTGFAAETRVVDAGTDSDSVVLNWNELTGQTPSVTGYKIYYSLNSDFSNRQGPVNVSGGSTTTATVTGLNDGATYYFQIYAVNDVGDSATAATTVSRAVSNLDYSLNGTGSESAATSTAVIPTSTSADFTFEFWAKFSNVTERQTMFSQGFSNSGFMVLEAGTLRMNLNNFESQASFALTTGRWYHIALSVDASDTSAGSKLFVDGQQVHSFSGARKSFADAGYGLGIGGNIRGNLDQVKVWSTALDSDQIKASMHTWQDAGVSGATLVSHYDFNDFTNTSSLRDQKGSNHLSYAGVQAGDLVPLVAPDTVTRDGYVNYKFTRTYLTELGGWQIPAGVTTADYLIIGGGGAGGAGIGGGGGAGEFLERTGQSVTSGVRSVKVGAGGISVINQAGSPGQTSAFGDVSVYGGGGGGTGLPGPVYVAPTSGLVGSGGGGMFYTSDSRGTGATASKQQADSFTFAGGNGSGGGCSTATSGGGGGAFAAGSNGISTAGGNGGDGRPSAITNQTLAGGGGGGVNGTGACVTSGAAGSGGAGGGGAGGLKSQDSPSTNGFSGLPNTGSGGGGSSNQNTAGVNGLGGSGGSGLVVFSYRLPSAAATDPSNISALTTQTATFSTDASGSVGTVSGYQWQVSSDGGSSFSSIAGATSNSYTTPALTSADNNKQYRAVVTASLNGSTDTVTTNAATLTVADIFSASRILYYNASDVNSFDPVTSPSEIKDLTGTYDGSVINGPGSSVVLENQAFRFSGANGDYIQTEDFVNQDFSNGVTFDFLAKFDGTDTSYPARVISTRNSDLIIVSATYTGNGDGTSPGFITLEYAHGSTNFMKRKFTDAIPDDGNYHRYTIVSSSSDDPNGTRVASKLYVDGVLHQTSEFLDSFTGPEFPNTTFNSTEFLIGNIAGASPSRGLNGYLRHLQIYNWAFNENQLNNLAVTYQTVSFDSNGGTDPAAMVTSGTIRLPSPGTKTGFTFGGWYTAEDYSTSAGDVGDTYTPGDTTLHAKWNSTLAITTPNSGLAATVDSSFTLDISSEVSGGPGGNSFALASGSLPTGLNLNTSTGVISGTPTSAGSSTVSVRVTDSSTAMATTSNFTITVSAAALSTVQNLTATATAQTLKSIEVSWNTVSNADSYTLKIYDAAGTTLLDTVSLANNLTSYTITDAVGSFESVADGTQYQISLTAVGSGNYVTSSESSKVSLTTTSSYSVTYNTNGATGGTAPSNQVKVHGVDLTLQSNSGSLEKTGYTFSGWNTQADGQGTNYAEGATYTVDADLPLYAKWVQSTFTVTWDSNGGSSIANGSFTAGGTLSAPTAPTKTDKIFGGWSTSESSNQGEISNRLTFPYSPPQTSAITLYAIWLSVAPPQNVSATAANQSLLVQWTAPSTVATEVPTGFQVEWSTTGTATGTWNISSSSIAANATSHTISGLTNGTSYYVRVVALYNGAKGAYGYPWTKLYEVASPNRDANNRIVYATGFGVTGGVASDYTGAAFSRVRYLMSATYSGQANWADVDFDKVQTTKSSISQNLSTPWVLQVPSVIAGENDFAIHGNVTDMRVQSSVASVDEGVGINGRLEIWPWNYGKVADAAFGDGDNGAYDYSDNTDQSGDYGSFQVHNLDGTPQTVMAWNRHRNNGNDSNIGFGNNPGTDGAGEPDWTYNTRVETDFSLEIFANIPVAPALQTYTITYKAGDGATGSDQTATKTQDVDLNLANKATGEGWFSKANHEITGWSVNANGSTADYALGATYSTNQALTLYPVWQAVITISTPTSGLSATFGEAYSLDVSTLVSGGASPLTFSASGLGSGLNINTSTGVISGTPTASGNLTVAVTVTDSQDNSASTSNFTISIAQKTLANSTAPTATAPAGELKKINVSWDSVLNASSYTLKIYSAADVELEEITGLTTTSTVITATQFAAIADGTQYKISVMAVGTGNYVSSAESAKTSVTTNETFTVTWNAQGGSSVSSTTFVEGGTVTLPSSPTKSGKVHAGWSTIASGGTGLMVNRIDEWPYEPAADQNFTLHAIWLDPCSPTTSTFVGTGTNDITSATYGANGATYRQLVFDSLTDCGWAAPTGVTDIDLLVVAGGGSGGYGQRGGGGGAGEVLRTSSGLTIGAGEQFLVDVGDGAGFSSSDNRGQKGVDTRFGYFTALGGGAGGGGNSSAYLASDGGSGGGGARCTTSTLGGASTATDRYADLVELGNAGGNSVGTCTAVSPGAGGGGAGGAGNNSGVGITNSGAGGAPVKIFGRVVAGGGAAWNSGSLLGGALDGVRVGGSWAGGSKNGVDGTGSGASSQGTGGSGIVVIRFEIPVQTLTLDNEGSTTTQSVEIGTSPTDPNITRTGYTLDGWSDDDDNSSEYAADLSDYTMGAAADTIYAVWTANDNTVTFKSNYSGGPTDKTQTITTDAPTALNQSFSRTGYTFDEWTTNADGTGTSYTLTETVTIQGDLTLYAQWIAATYTLTYNYNGATGGNTAATASYTSGTAPITLAVPVRTGYTFAGWYLDSGFGGSALGETLTLTADDDVYAKWTANTYTVIFNYNGATGGNTEEDDTYTTGDAATEITLPTPTRTGYTFGGWYEAADFSGSAKSSPYTTSLNRTIHAKWDAIDYALSYDANGGSGSVPSASVNYNYQDTVPVLGRGSLTRTGFTFLGWTTNAGGTGTLYESGDSITMPAAAVTLYAKWQANTYTISYNLNGGSGSLSGAPTSWTTDTANVSLPTTGFTRTGFNFDGWQELGSTTKQSNSYFPNYENVTLVARWTLKDISVTYAKGLASGTGVSDLMLSGLSFPSNFSNKFGSTITLSNALAGAEIEALGGGAVDHEFFGWKDGSTTYQPNDTYVLTETAPIFTAQWARIYQVNYAYNGGTPAAGDGQFDSQCLGGDNTCSNGQTIQLNSAPERDGYIFTGWKDQSGASYTAGGNMTVDGDSFLLYAQWQAIDYQFTFNRLGGSLDTPRQELNIGQILTFPDPGSKIGYTFGGWSADGGTTKFDKGATLVVGTSGAAYSAVWIPNVYQISYDLNGGTGTPISGSFLSYEVGTGNMSLPPEGDLNRDGYTFGGWSETRGGTAVEDYQPTQDRVLYAVWNDGNFTLSYNPKGGNGGSGNGTVARTQSVTLPTPVRNGFVFTGWYDAETGGTKIGNGGATHTPGRSKTLYARWVQRSLYGVDPATLENASSKLTATARGGSNQVGSITSGSISASVTVPAGALPAGTVVEAKYFKDTVRQSALIPGDNQYFFSVLVSWLSGSGDTATVPDTDPDLPVSVTINSDAIKIGARIYQVIGDQVTDLGVATQNSTVTVQLYEDPEIVIAATKPEAPTGVSGTVASTQSNVSWTAPANNGGAEITSYTVTASPGGATCSTATTSCTVTGLTNGTAYTFTVTATNSVGTSDASSPSAAVTPGIPNYTVTYNSNGGSAVSNGTFADGASIATAPTAPTRSGYTFDGWSTTLNDASTKVTFPYTPGVSANITLYALWTQNQSSGGTPSQPVVVPPVTPTPTPDPTPSPTPGPVAPPSQIGFEPTPPATPVSQTGPVGNVVGSSQQVRFTADAPKENLVASGLGWQIKVRVEEPARNTVRVTEELGLEAVMTATVAVTATGLRSNTYVEVWAFSDETYIGTLQVGSNGQLSSELELPDTLLPGEHTLQIGTLNTAGQLITLSIPLTVKGKVTVGTFKGYIAIYTADIHGQRLSAKVAGKWVVQDPIRRYKQFTYSRLVRFTGAGYDIIVDVYINRKFYERSTTRTR